MSVKVITRTLYLPLLKFFLFPHDQVFMPFPSSGTLRLKLEVFFFGVILIQWLQAILDTEPQIF